MRALFIALFFAMTLVSCKNDKKDADVAPQDATHASVNNGSTIVRGEYIFFEDVAVLTTNSEIFEVVQDETMKSLEQKAKQFKKQPSDMVMVTLKVDIISNPKREKTPDVWEKAIKIKEIMEVKPTVSSPNTTIK
ncbi:MAG: hypothetical protein NWQ19_10950 [Nonlabens sp.]|jgi:hypothetical protein|nr:hypothetical protein [Nonlabens sp.]